MLDNGIARKGRCQEMVVDGGKYFCWSRYRCFIVILLLTAVLIFYNTNIMEMAADWSPKWWTQYNRPTHTPISPNPTGFNGNNSDSIFESTVTGVTNATSAPVYVQTEVMHTINISTTTEVHDTTVPTAKVTQQTTEIKAVLPVPIPYVSPGQYFVEYPYEYHFRIDEPERCKQQKPFLVLMVPVAPHNKAARDIIRSTWGSESLILGKVVNLFFLLGLPKGDGSEKVQEQVLKESREHGDLLQSDFLDCYKNLTIKTMVMMEWLDSRCSSASYAMKIDSDMFLNAHNLVNMLLNAPKLNYMTGLVANGAAVLRDPNSKWYLPVEVFPESQYPRYALGLGYVFSLDLPRKLVEASRQVKAVYIEDVYLGLCMRHLGIPPTNPPDWKLFQVSPVPYNRCAYSQLIATTTISHTDPVWAWKDFKRPGPFC